MEWKKAKNYTIFFLLAVNCLLLILNIVKLSETRLGAGDIQAVSKVLSKRGININCELPQNFSDMGQLSMRQYEYDNIVLQEIFFGKISGVRRTESGSNIVFSGDEGVLTISGKDVHFESTKSFNAENLEQARGYVNAYVDKLNYNFSDYRERIGKQLDGEYYFEYGQNFHGKPVFSNYLKADVNGDGKLKMTFNYQQPIEYKGSREAIISADEAVYAAAYMILTEADSKPVSVDIVEKGYYLNERNGEELAAVPQYKIYIDGGKAAYYVNAYSGDVISD